MLHDPCLRPTIASPDLIWHHTTQPFVVSQPRNTAHTGKGNSRCLCVIFINASTSAVQFLEMRWGSSTGTVLYESSVCCLRRYYLTNLVVCN